MQIAIIPARSGSERIPSKNTKHFLGTPIIGRVITLIKQSDLFDRIIVSTDSKEIADLAENYGAEVPFLRPTKLSDNFADTKSVIAHAIETLAIKTTKVDYCCVYPTSVLMTQEDLKQSYILYTEGSWEFVFTAFMMEPSPLRGFEIDIETGGLIMLHPKYWDFRSQDLPPTYLDAGLLYWGNERSWKSKEPIFGPRSSFLEIPKNRAVDINNFDDWVKAEHIYSTQNPQARDGN